MKIPYKYKIGQKVRLKNVNYLNSYYFDKKYCEKILNKEVTIINRGFDYGDSMYGGPLKKEKLKLTIFYYIAENPITYNGTMFYEDAFEGEAFDEVVDEKTISADNEEVKLGTKLYNNVLVRSNDKLCINTNFVFASEGPCVRISKNFNSWDSRFDPFNDKDTFIFESCREFLCQGNINGNVYECGDARRYGNRDKFYSKKAYTKLPDNFVELYVDTLLDKDCFYGGHSIYDDNFAWEIEQWLRHFGVWEQVKESYDKRVPREQKLEESEEENDKLNQLLAGLSEKEREKLKEML